MTKLHIWVDIETTGLNSAFNWTGIHAHKILEIGIHITDEKYNILDKGFNAVIKHDVAEAKRLCNDFVMDMHTSNGLFDAVERSELTMPMVSEQIVEYLKSHGCDLVNKSDWCGSSVGFDHTFIEAQLPDVAKFFTHRHLDVSSIVTLAKNINPDIMIDYASSESDHRALGDIKRSINLLRFINEKITLA